MQAHASAGVGSEGACLGEDGALHYVFGRVYVLVMTLVRGWRTCAAVERVSDAPAEAGCC